MTDHQLMLAVRDGEVQKLGLLFEKYQKQLYNFFLKQLGNRQLCEDMVQDVFFRMLKYRHTYRGNGKFTTWMFQIARNVRVDFFRKHRYKTEPLEQAIWIESNEPNPENGLEQKDEATILKIALMKLAPEKREVIVLSRFHYKTYEEIGKITGCKVGTIKARVFHALKELSKIYKELVN